MQKDFKLDEEELQFLEDIENDNFVELKEEELQNELNILQTSAKNKLEELTKKKSYTMKFIESDIETMKSIALEKGLPYQTFMASIIHQLATTRQIKI
jgi:predicted DNA binding CopG/RHH family protein